MGLSGALYGWDVALASAFVTLTTVIYDDLAFSGHWIGKNACNILGYGSFEVGATMVMGEIYNCIGDCNPSLII
jgi:hypothetical protein